jgi:acetyl-CoA carboxylase biotin carboxyl carrier protein
LGFVTTTQTVDAAPQHALPSRAETALANAGRPGFIFGPAMADICAHITGTVWKILVKEGDTVEEEQAVVILESMKMEMPVEAPEKGRVTKVAVTEGQAVDEGDVLVTVE